MRRLSSRNQNAGARRALLSGAFAFVCFVACSVSISDSVLQAATSQAAPTPTQVQIGAAFIFNFAKFTEWPTKEFPNAASPMTVCFVAAEEVRAAFEGISTGKDLNGHPVIVRDVRVAADVLDCRVVYLESPTNVVATGALKNARLGCALAIGTSDDFLERGGMIRLLVEDNRMRFDVNVGAVNRAKVHLSSKLLALARSVVDLPEPGSN